MTDINVGTFIRDFIRTHHTAVLASVSGAQPIASTVYYVVGADEYLYFKSRTNSSHSIALTINALAALAIYDPASTYDLKTGVQFLGSVKQVTDRAEMLRVMDLYGEKFGSSAASKLHIDELLAPDTESTMYRFDIAKVKLVSHELKMHMNEYKELSLL